jgi:Ca2+-binding EF-hand superfamily protein
MDITAGYPLFNDVINYWREVVDPDYDDSQVQELIEGMELNKDGSVDLEEMQ